MKLDQRKVSLWNRSTFSSDNDKLGQLLECKGDKRVYGPEQKKGIILTI